MGTKQDTHPCRGCKKIFARKDLSIHGKYMTKLYGERTVYTCRDCNTARIKSYRKTEQGKLAVERAIKSYEARNPQRRKAWSAVAGKPVEPCAICGSLINIHRHHEDPYKRHEIVHLCAWHHKQVHLGKTELAVKSSTFTANTV